MNENGPKDVGSRLIEVSYEVLTENLGREPEPTEFCEMAETMVADLLASSYVELRSYRGAEAAEKWLKKVLSMVSAGVRASGSDAFIHIDVAIKDVPNRIIHKTPEAPKESQPSRQAPICDCNRVDGRCVSCQDVLMREVMSVFGAIKDLHEFKEKRGTCLACGITELDHAMARLVPEFWGEGEKLETQARKEFATDLIGVLAMAAAFRGVNEIPVTLKAWTKAVKDSGIDPEA